MAQTTYVVCVDESGKHADALRTAVERARTAGARLILFDVAAGGAMTDPRPNIWAGEGEREMYQHPLDPVELEKLGRHRLALDVKHARDAGVDAYGWLPNSVGPDALVKYAAEQHAELILVPTDLETPVLTDTLPASPAVEFVG